MVQIKHNMMVLKLPKNCILIPHQYIITASLNTTFNEDLIKNVHIFSVPSLGLEEGVQDIILILT